MRSGTLSPALCVGFGAAAKLAAERCDRDYDHVQGLWDAAIKALGAGLDHQRRHRCRYQGNLNIRRDGVDAARLLADLRGIAFSLGIGLRQRLRPAKPCASRARAWIIARRGPRSGSGFGRYTKVQELTDACRQIAAAVKAQEHLVA